MHPAYSVIFFTVSSGAGYGLLIWLTVSRQLDLVPLGSRGASVIALAALVLVTAGLLSSTFHLGHPERALNIMVTPNFQSAMAGFGFIYLGYLVLVGIMLFASIEAAGLLGFATLADLGSQFIAFADDAGDVQ